MTTDLPKSQDASPAEERQFNTQADVERIQKWAADLLRRLAELKEQLK